MFKDFFENIVYNVNKLILLLFIIIVPFSALIPLYAQSPKICKVRVRAYPGKDPVMWDGVYAASDGSVYSGLITEPASAHFYVYDPIKDKNELLFDMAEFLGVRGKGIRTQGKIHNKPVEGQNGYIYFVTMNNGSGPRNIDYTSWVGGHWLRYNPDTRTLEDLGLVDKGVGLYPLTLDEERNYLYGIGFQGYLYRFDIENRISVNLGRVSSWDICRNIFSDDKGNVYGSYPVSHIWKYDAETEKIKNLPICIPYDPSVYPTQIKNPMIDRTTIWRAIQWDPLNKVAYGVTCGSGSILFRFDPHAGSTGRIQSLGRICDPKFWNTDRKDIPYSPLAFAVDSEHQKVYFVPSAREYSIKEYVETFRSKEAHHLIMYDIRMGKRVDLGKMNTTDGRRVFGCEGATIAPDGTVYIVGQVEVENKENATRFIGDIPVALHLIIYKP